MTKNDPRAAKVNDADRKAAARLRAIWETKRKDIGLTQATAGEAMGITQGAVSHYLTARIPLGAEAVLKWAALLGVAPEDIRPDLADLMHAPSIMQHRANAVGEEPGIYKALPDFLRLPNRGPAWASESPSHTRLAAALDRHAAQLSPAMAESVAVMIESAAGRPR